MVKVCPNKVIQIQRHVQVIMAILYMRHKKTVLFIPTILMGNNWNNRLKPSNYACGSENKSLL